MELKLSRPLPTVLPRNPEPRKQLSESTKSEWMQSIEKTLLLLNDQQTGLLKVIRENKQWINQKQAEEIQLAISIQNQSLENSLQYIPYEADQTKLPVHYNEKTFPLFSLPILHIKLFFREMLRKTANLVVTPDASLDSTAGALYEAHQERKLIIIMRIQRLVGKIQKALAKAIRKNRDSFIYEVGNENNENVLLATGLKKYFEHLYSKVAISVNNRKVFLHIEIDY